MNVPDEDTAMASTSTLPNYDSHKTPVVVILRDSMVPLSEHPGNVLPFYINPLLQRLGEAKQPSRVSLHFIRSPFEHHLTFISIAIPSSHGRV